MYVTAVCVSICANYAGQRKRVFEVCLVLSFFLLPLFIEGVLCLTLANIVTIKFSCVSSEHDFSFHWRRICVAQ